jgi:hypothetical protein
MNIEVIAGISMTLFVLLLMQNNNINNVFGSGDIFSNTPCGNDVRGIDARVPLLLNFCTIPSTVTVGDNFTVNAMLLNNSPNSIRIAPTGQFCDNPLTVTFDRNVKINPSASMPACIPAGPERVIDPGQHITLSTLPERGIASFVATSTGQTNATLKLVYSRLHDHSVSPDSVCGSFIFKIGPSSILSAEVTKSNNETAVATPGSAVNCDLVHNNPNDPTKAPCRPPFIPDPDDPRRCVELHDKLPKK